MSQKIKSTINVAKFIAPIVSSRDIVERLKYAIKKANTELVDLDFREVEFISRSAAHELLLIKEDFKQNRFCRKNISFVNTNNNIKEMLRIVAANRALPKYRKPEFKAERVNVESLAA